MSPTKRCWDCETVKPIEEFANDPSKKDGKHGRCRECDRVWRREWRKEHPNETRLRGRANRAKSKRTIAGFAAACWKRLNQRTVDGAHPRPENKHIRVYLDQGIQLQITREQLTDAITAWWPKIRAMWAAGQTPSIDRIDSTRHYSPDNIQFIPLSENCRKSGLKSGRARAILEKNEATDRMYERIRHLEGDRYLTKSELAAFLGVSLRTIDRRVADGTLPPPILLGQVRRWRQSVVIAKLERHKSL